MQNTNHYNYVVLFNDGRIKIGRSGNMKKRLGYFKDVYACLAGRPVDPIIARFVEREIRRTFKGRTLPGTLEWFGNANKSTAVAFAEMTARMQTQLTTVLAVSE